MRMNTPNTGLKRYYMLELTAPLIGIILERSLNLNILNLNKARNICFIIHIWVIFHVNIPITEI